jgi:hypothetical protein
MMASPFAITTPTTAVHLAENRLGEMPFTVTNVTDQPLRGRVSIVPLGSAPLSWFSLAGKAEIDLPPRVTAQVLVRVEPPLGTPAGTHLFRVDIDSSADPGAVTVGPSCSVVVPPSVSKVNRWRTPRGYLATLLGASIGGAVGELVVLLAVRAPEPRECGADVGCAFGEAIGQAFFLAVAILFGLVLLWVGSVAGAWVGLRARRYLGSKTTALFLAILTVPWTAAMLWLLGRTTDSPNLVAVMIAGPVLLTAVPGVLARAAVLLIRTRHI